jgi:hypothetical protein
MKRWIVWTPRVLGILVTLFIAAFALDAFSGAQPFGAALADFAIHLMPSLVLLGVVILSWRWPWVGGAAFIALAVLYALASPRLAWTLAIGGPLLVVGALFLWSWRHAAATHKAA